MESRYLLVNLSALRLRSGREFNQEYLSVLWDGRFYFSSAYGTRQAENHSIALDHSFVLPLSDPPCLSLLLQAWQNHMIVFQHEVDLGELRTRPAARKKVEVRQGEILEFTVHLLEQEEFQLAEAYREDVAQHYLLLHSLALHDDDKGPDHGPSYLVARHDAGEIVLPVVNAVAIVPLPSRIRFQHFKNGKLKATSRECGCGKLLQGQPVRMVAGEDIGYDLSVGVWWGINFWRHRPDRAMLLDAQELLIYEIEARLETGKEMAGAKLKITCGNRSYELGGDFDSAGSSQRFGRIIYLVMKSEEEDFEVILQRKERAVGRAIIGSEELLSHQLNTVRRKLLDGAGRTVANVRFKCQKCKNLSLPQNNPFWKAQNAKSKQQAVLLELSQLSLEWEKEESCGLIVKSEEEELFVPSLTNINFFQLETEIPEPVVLALKQECNVYLKLVEAANKNDFLGIAVLNYKDLRLGVNVLSLTFFKQQTASCILHLIINKVVPYPFLRGINIPQTSGMPMRLLGISVQVRRLQLTAYYHTFRYDRKDELYCIVEVNRIKKVLILQQLASRTSALLFVNASGSDLLNFTADQLGSAKVRLTLLVAEGGVEEEVYGVLQRKVRVEQLQDGPVRMDGLQLANDHGVAVGEVDLQLQMGMAGQLKRPIKKDLRNVQDSLAKVNKSIERVERSISRRDMQMAISPKKRYQSLKLPEIKDPKQQRLKRLAKMLQLKQSIDAKNNRKRRAQSERRVEEKPFHGNSGHQAYTNIELDLPDLYDSRAKRSYDHDLDPSRDIKQETPLELHFPVTGQIQSPEPPKTLDVQLEQNQFADTLGKAE